MFLADFHIHSNFSDGQLSIPELIDFYGQRHFGAIAITDHLCEEKTWLGMTAQALQRTLTRQSFADYMALIAEEKIRAWEQYKMVVFAGFELTKNSLLHHRSAHLLGIGISDYIAADGDVFELAQAIKSQGALCVAAHPLPTGKLELQTRHLWDRRKELDPLIDAWEVGSGDNWFKEVAQSGLPALASSDLHTPRQLTSWKTVLDCERHPEAILEAIRRQNLSCLYYQDRQAESFSPHLSSFEATGPLMTDEHLACTA